MPISAALTTNKIYKAFYADYAKKKTFYHGHTYTANPIACAAAIASIKLFKQENTLKRIAEIIPFFHKRLEEFKKLKLVGDVRYKGLIGAIELVKNKKTKQPFSLEERIGLDIYKKGLKKGLILRPLGSIVYFYLPLCIKKKELSYVLDETCQIIENL